MSDKRYELVRAEDEQWAQLCGLLGGLDPETLERPGVTPDWTGKDLVAHLACWMAECANVLERMRLGTWERQPLDLDAMNARFYEACRDLDLPTIRAELESARTRMLQEWGWMGEQTPEAEEWFRESGPAHIEEHLPALRRFVEGKGEQT
jgi:hypothetical protein